MLPPSGSAMKLLGGSSVLLPLLGSGSSCGAVLLLPLLLLLPLPLPPDSLAPSLVVSSLAVMSGIEGPQAIDSMNAGSTQEDGLKSSDTRISP
jgi:hypothetical protein